jgi:hypothetical protein
MYKSSKGLIGEIILVIPIFFASLLPGFDGKNGWVRLIV